MVMQQQIVAGRRALLPTVAFAARVHPPQSSRNRSPLQCECDASNRRHALLALVSLGASAVAGGLSSAWAQEAAEQGPSQAGEPTAATELASSPLQPQPQPSGEPAGPVTRVPLTPEELTDEAARKLLEEEEERRKARRRKRGRIRELEEIRAELAEKELVLLQKEKELLEKEQTLAVLREELEIGRKLQALLTKEKEKAEEEAALAMGLCAGGAMLP